MHSKAALCIACSFIFSRYASSTAADDWSNTIHRRLVDSVTTIQTLSAVRDPQTNTDRMRVGLGTGFLFQRDPPLILTAAHVIRDATQVSARFLDGTTERCDLVDVDDGYDLALLRIAKLPSSKSKELPLTQTVPKATEEILHIGNPGGLDFSAFVGRFVRTRSSTEIQDEQKTPVFTEKFSVFQLDITATHGCSGGPVIDKDGKVFGVMVASHMVDTERLNICIPATCITQLRPGNRPRPFGDKHAVSAGTASNAKLKYSAATGTRAPEARRKDGVAINLQSTNMGKIPQQLLPMYVDDKQKYNNCVRPDHHNMLFARKAVYLITNVAFRYSLLVPEGYSLSESYNPETGIFRSEFSGAVNGETLSISAYRHGQSLSSNPEQNLEAFNRLAEHWIKNELRYERVDSPFRDGQMRTTCGLGPLSDPLPRSNATSVGPDTTVMRAWRDYRPTDNSGRALIVIYAMNRDVFIVLTQTGYPQKWIAPVIPEGEVERLFMCATFSLIP